MPKGIRVAVCDIYPIFRVGAVQAIRRGGMVVVGQAETSNEVARIINKRSFDLLLLEPAIPDSLGLASSVLRTNRDAKVVFLAAERDDEHADAAICAGVHGYLMKGISGTELVASIRAVYGGERRMSPELAWFLLADKKREALGPLESQVLDHASAGRTNHEIAGILGLSISTIKRCKTKLFRRIGVRNRVQAAVELRRAGTAKPTVA